jgi:hypothetical protein
MDIGLYPTLGLVALSLELFAFAYWRAHKPAEPLKVRLMNYHYLMFFSAVLVLVMLAHLISVITGHPFTGRNGR